MKRLYIVMAIVSGCLWVWPSLPYAFQSGLFPDFDEDGVVGFADFVKFAAKFGAERGDETYEDRFDLDEDGSIGFPDFLIFAGSFGKASPYGGNVNNVLIPDANLRAVIADSLGKKRDAPITRVEMATLDELEAQEANIEDLTGLQFAVNLESLWLTGNGFSDISPLCDLTNLKNLVLFGNAISDLSPLSGLINLTQLNLNDNRVSDLSPLAVLKKLKHLWLLNNRVADMSTLSGLTDLAALEIGGTGLTDLSVIAGLTNLTELGLSNNNISDITSISALTNLAHLDLSLNRLSDITDLASLKGLIVLNLNDNMAADLSSLANLNNLADLWLSGNKITDLSVLAGMTKLIELGLSNNEITDISSISGLINLMYLDLSGNCVSDLTALSPLTNLTHLDVSDNRIMDFSPLVASGEIGSGDQVDVRNNPSSTESIDIHIPGLRDKGVDVRFDIEPELICIPILPDELSVDAGSSHTLQTNYLFVDQHRIRSQGRRGDGAAVAYADFNGDGHVDIFYAPSEGWQLEPTVPAELYLNDGTGCFTLDTSFLGANPPGRLAPRKALSGDFNGDGRMDVFVLDHGYDKPPFPGAAPYVILSSEDGYVLGSGLETFVGFQHGGASGDVDDDGDIDVFVTHLNTTDGPFFLINDGAGSFALNTDRVEGLAQMALFTAELVDVDGDAYLDLLVGGHEHEIYGNDLPTQILWGDSTGTYSTGRATVLPAVIGHGVVVDIDVSDTDGDGDRDIVINRTGDERSSSYQGYYVQLVEQVAARRFEDRTAQLFSGNEDPDADWIVWIRICDCDVDGDVDIVVDNAARNLIWKNDGTGKFRPR